MTVRETTFEGKRWAHRWPILLLAVVVVGFLVIIDLQPYFEYRSKENKIRQLIPIGSNINDAGSILTANGFTYHEKHFATVAEDEYWIDVDVANKPRPLTLTLLHVAGIRLYFHWIVIESGLDNKVRRIF
jgi:hypothetical protein